MTHRDATGVVLHAEDWPPVAGWPGLTQGAYGSAGNRELVAPAVDDGIWVGSFNNDPVDAPEGAAIQRWSGALRFAIGARYRSAAITQLPWDERCGGSVTLLCDGRPLTRWGFESAVPARLAVHDGDRLLIVGDEVGCGHGPAARATASSPGRRQEPGHG